MDSKLVMLFAIVGVVVVTFFAYSYFIAPQTTSSGISREAQQAIENATEIKAVTGTLVEIGNENLVLRTNGDILTIKKSADTKYVAVSGGESSPIAESGLRAQDQVTVVAGVDTASNEAVALSVTVVRR